MPAPLTLLVVDDDPAIRKLLEVTFEMDGYRVVLAADGPEGLALARTEHPDAVLLDVMMPGMNGLEVAVALRSEEATATVPIVALTAKVQQDDKDAGLRAGVNEYVTKPFDPFELAATVSRLVGSTGR